MAGPDPDSTQDLLRSVLELMPCPSILIEPGTAAILFANTAALRTAIPELVSEGGGLSGARAVDPEGYRIPPELWPHRRAARGERLDGLQVTWDTPEGPAAFVISSGAMPIRDGRPPLAVMTFIDVTRLKATEAELRQAVRVRDDFFSFATHELRDPLSSLLLSIEVLKRMADRQDVVPSAVLRERLDVSKRQGDRLSRLIENLLDVSRIANGRLQLDPEALDLRDLIVEVVGRYREQARESGVDLVVEPSGPVIGYFDRIQLEHAVGNLVANALKYGAGRPVHLRVRFDPETATLEVEDQGIGIAQADQARIFERFERATDGHREKSLGLGLSIVRAVVEAHGGSISLKSAPGLGATFVVELPRKRMPGDDSVAGRS